VATDAFLEDWSQLQGFANPPWCLIHRCLTKVEIQSARIVLITPFWKTQSWFSVVLERLPQSVADPIRSGNAANGTTVSNVRGSPTTDCLAHLRESYSSQGLFDEASKLMLSSWRN